MNKYSALGAIGGWLFVNIGAIFLGLTDRFLPLFSWPVLLSVGLGSVVGQILFPVILGHVANTNTQSEKEDKGQGRET